MQGFFKDRNKDKNKGKLDTLNDSSEVSNNEPVKIGSDITPINSDSVELSAYLYEHNSIDNCYNNIRENNVNSEDILQLCKEVNSKIKEGSILSKVPSFTTQTLATEILKVYCLIIKDDVQQDVKNINEELETAVGKLNKAQGALEEAQSAYKNLKIDYDELSQADNGNTISSCTSEEKEKYESDIQLLEDTIEKYQKEIEMNEVKLKDMSDSLDRSNKELIGLNQSLDKISSASADTVDDRFQELLKDSNAKDLEIAKLNSNIITINRDLKQARNDAKTREYNTAAITGLKGSIAMLTEDIEKTTSELMSALDEVARLQQEAIVSEQEIIAYKAQTKSLRAKAQIAVKAVMSGERAGVVSSAGTGSEAEKEIASSIASANIEREIGNIDIAMNPRNNASLNTLNAKETIVDKEPEIIIQGIAEETVQKLMVAAMQLRGMQKSFNPAYRNDMRDQLTRLIDSKDSFDFNLGAVKVELERIFADVITAE